MKTKWIILTIVIALFAGAWLYLHFRKSKDFEPQIKAKLSELVSNASNGLYKLDMEHIDIDVTNGSVIAKNIYLLPDSARMLVLEKAKLLGNDIFTIHLKQVELNGLSPLDLLDKKNIDLGEIILDSPEIKMLHKKRTVEKKDTAGLYDKINIGDQSYSVGKLKLNNIKLTIVNLDKNKQENTVKNLSAIFTDIIVSAATISDSTRFLFAKDAVVFIKGYHSASKNNMYNFSIDSIALKPMEESLKFFDLRLKPVGTKDEFSAKLKVMKDMFDIQVGKGEVKNIRWFDLLSGDGFYGDEMTIKGGYVKVYDDRRLPTTETKVGKFPHQLLMQVGIPINIPKLQLNDLKISYEEFNPKANKTGKVEFTQLNAEVQNLTNIKERIAENPVLSITAVSKLMNAGELTAKFRFRLDKAATGDFEVDALLGKMDGRVMNETTNGLALMNIKECTIDKLQAKIKGSNYSSNGMVTFEYHDLNVEMLKADEEGDTKKKGIVSFIANTFIIKKSNPKEGETAKNYSVVFTRDIHKSFFNLIWKTILEGMKKSVKR